MSELQKKDEVRAAAEEAEKKRKGELHVGQAKKKEDDPREQHDAAIQLGWDSEIDTFFDRLGDFTHGLSMPLSSQEFRTLSLFYRQHSVMEKRVIANRLQRKGMHAFLRALHAGDFRAYQDSWQAEAEAVRGHEEPAPADKA